MYSSSILPKLEEGQYLVQLLNDAGVYSHTATGKAVLTWTELDAMNRSLQLELEAWEMRVIRDMSRRYLSGLRTGSDELSIPPTQREKHD